MKTIKLRDFFVVLRHIEAYDISESREGLSPPWLTVYLVSGKMLGGPVTPADLVSFIEEMNA